MATSEALFTSKRERRLWLWALAVVVAIYSTLGLARTLAEVLRDRGLISDAIWLGLFLLAAAIALQGLKVRPGGIEIGVALGIAGVYLLVFMRMAIPEERSHLIEYTMVALFIYEALTERLRNGRKVPVPAALAWVIATLVGVLDETIQAILPNRVFDVRDIGFNALAALMAIVASLLLAWARQWRSKAHAD